MLKFMGFVRSALIKMKINLDRIVISLSAFCALHCVILAVIAGALPLLFGLGQHGHEHGHGLHDLLFHQIILFFILPISLPALWFGYQQHRKLLPGFVSVMGLLLLLTATAFIDRLIDAGLLALEYESLLTLMGGIIHAVGHWLNLKASAATACVKSGLA